MLFGFESCFLSVVCFFCLLLSYFCYSCDFWLPIKKTSLKTLEIPKKPQNKKKTDIVTRAVSTVVFTNSVFFFFFCVSLKLASCFKKKL